MSNQLWLSGGRLYRLLLGATLYSFALLPSFSGVVVTQNISVGATNWPNSPLIQTVTNPAAQTAVGESFNAVGGCTNYAQTFTITTTNYTLQTISLYAGGGTGTASGTNLTLHLFDLGIQTSPNPSPYTPGTDLLNSGAGLTITYAIQNIGVLQFDFTGSDQVTLLVGHMYAFEVDGPLNSSPLLWERTTSDTYSSGAAYRNQTWINGNSAREFSLAVYATVLMKTNSAATNVVWIPIGIDFHAFSTPTSGVNGDGANPSAGLALLGNVLCGTALNGGAAGAGSAFFLTLDGTNFNTFRTFTNAPDAGNPQGSLAISGSSLFGTTAAGGTNGTGTIFAGSTNGLVNVLRSFAAVSADNATNSGGASPTVQLTVVGNTIFGTAMAGGMAANGTIFSLTTNGSAFTVLHDFTALDANTGTNPDGALPGGGVVASGNLLFGTASAGGSGGAGIVFSLGTNGANFTVLHNFTGLDPVSGTNPDGAFPSGGLVLSNGLLYGTAPGGGIGGRGVVFAMQTNGFGFTILHHFSAIDSLTGTNLDGASPSATLALAGGNLYGTSPAGGANANGTVFSVSTNGTAFQTIHAFTAVDSIYGTNSDGAQPVAGVLPLENTLYGSTFSGGPGGVGTIFNISIPFPPAVITNVLHDASGRVILSFLGGSGSTNVIQTTASLVSPVVWRSVATNIADAAGRWQFTETATTNTTQFYRSYAPQN